MAAGAIDNPFEDQPSAPTSSGQSIDNPFESTQAQAAPTAKISAAPGGVRGWLSDLEADVRYGSGFTAPGRLLQKIGYQGTNTGAQQGAGDFIGSPVLGPVHAAQGVAEIPQHPVKGALHAVQGAAETATIPSMIADPMLANSTSSIAEGVANAAKKTPQALSDAWGTIQQAFSKGAVTKDMAAKLSTSLDSVAANAGLPASQEASLSGKATDIVNGLKKQAQTTYGQLDQASGGRYQRFVDEIDELQDALRNKYTTPDQAKSLKTQLSQVQNDYAKVQQELVAQGVDPNTIRTADAKWAQAKALEAVGKKFRVGETLAGDLKPGTTSIDTGLKNLKPHILPQATKSEAPAITNAVTEATQKVRNVNRNRAIAGAGAALAGAGGAVKYGRALSGR